MIGKVIAALFGAEVERSRGGNAVKGAALGAIASAVVRRVGPIGLVIGGVYVAKKAYDRRRGTGDGAPPPA